MKSSKLHDVVVYLCTKYPYKSELSKARTTKLVYLADWRSALSFGTQITEINWYFNHYGPYVDDVTDIVRTSPDLHLVSGHNAYGSPAEWIRLDSASPSYPSLTANDVRVLESIIEATQTMNFSRFLSLVYETYPVKQSKKYTYLDLVKLAAKRRAEIAAEHEKGA